MSFSQSLPWGAQLQALVEALPQMRAEIDELSQKVGQNNRLLEEQTNKLHELTRINNALAKEKKQMADAYDKLVQENKKLIDRTEALPGTDQGPSDASSLAQPYLQTSDANRGPPQPIASTLYGVGNQYQFAGLKRNGSATGTTKNPMELVRIGETLLGDSGDDLVSYNLNLIPRDMRAFKEASTTRVRVTPTSQAPKATGTLE